MDGFIIGFAMGALVASIACYGRHVAGQAERRPVPAPEPDTVLAVGQSWVLNGVYGASAVVITAVIDGQVFYAHLGQPEHNMHATHFMRLYRRI